MTPLDIPTVLTMLAFASAAIAGALALKIAQEIQRRASIKRIADTLRMLDTIDKSKRRKEAKR